ncbi:FGGY family carbohydrate kinase [Diaminobutyricibacter sp. McL0618]|uniref:FGGY family carbohydrate kinase n=1 Tax=Leifsonia sp. McL0618 TaxID=3415677 RepID=UPI003CE8F2BA
MDEPAGSAVIVAVDQGTSSTKALAVDAMGNVVGWGSVTVGQQHPQAGWVEQDAAEIADSAIEAVRLAVSGIAYRVAGIALSTQRESAVIWDRATGEPLGPVLGWQDRRTVAAAQALTTAGHGDRVRHITGLPVDPMFSALKFAWLLDRVDPGRERANRGEIAVGTVDSWLVHRLTGEFRIETGNASRTALLDLATLDWSDELLEIFRIPRAALPPVFPSNAVTAPVTGLPMLPAGTRIHAVLGDSHAALYGHGARTPGSVKVTLGTGSSIMGLLDSRASSPDGLVTTVAWSDPGASYAFEGNILSTGATLVWLAEVLETTPAELAALAAETDRDADPGHGVDLVPAFSGLGAPWWDDDARAIITGFDLSTSRDDLARAAVESIPLQIEDVLCAAESSTGRRFDTILIDGGPAANDWLAQLLADLSQRKVQRPDVAGLSALGAAHLAGIGAGVWTADDVLGFDRNGTTFEPIMSPATARARRQRWREAIALARARPEPRHPHPYI